MSEHQRRESPRNHLGFAECESDPVAVVDDAFRSATWPNQDTPRSCSWCWRVLPEHEAGCEAVELAALRKVAEAARAVVEAEMKYRREWHPGISGSRHMELEAARSYRLDLLGREISSLSSSTESQEKKP